MGASDFAEPALDQAVQRRTMVDCQIRTVDVTDHAVIARFLEVPRETFLPPDLAPFAYSDMALKLPAAAPGEAARQMLPPAVLARLIQAAAVKPSDKVLDIAAASGYSTAIFAGLAKEVVALEAAPERSAAIEANLAALGMTSVRVLAGPLAEGAPSAAPFDVIFVNGAVESQLDGLFRQLRSGGRLLAIVRKTADPGAGASHAVRFDCQSGRISSSRLFDADAAVLTEFRKQAEFVF
jgi:protein-L-isoaspartate(D-aspartate) O-methyltransferase